MAAGGAVGAAEELVLARRELAPPPEGEEEAALEVAVQALEADGGPFEADLVEGPGRAAVEGEWELVYISKSKFSLSSPLGKRVDGSAPGLEALFKAASSTVGAPSSSSASSSPIQRAVTSLKGVRVTQTVALGGGAEGQEQGRCDQRVEALDGTLTLELRARAEPEGSRINFSFEKGTIGIRTPWGSALSLPYPVPFQLLGDEARGWLDNVYLSDSVRLARGNKGTAFLFRRAP